MSKPGAINKPIKSKALDDYFSKDGVLVPQKKPKTRSNEEEKSDIVFVDLTSRQQQNNGNSKSKKEEEKADQLNDKAEQARVEQEPSKKKPNKRHIMDNWFKDYVWLRKVDDGHLNCHWCFTQQCTDTPYGTALGCDSLRTSSFKDHANSEIHKDCLALYLKKQRKEKTFIDTYFSPQKRESDSSKSYLSKCIFFLTEHVFFEFDREGKRPCPKTRSSARGSLHKSPQQFS